jgi:hypothetical protein
MSAYGRDEKSSEYEGIKLDSVKGHDALTALGDTLA